jgi:hypothetical protein
MLVKLPTTTVYRYSPPDGLPGPLFAMGIGPGVIDGRVAQVRLIEEELDVWSIGAGAGLDLHDTHTMGECVTVPGKPQLLGVVLPAEVDGRPLPRHVVLRDEDTYRAYEDLEAVRALHGEVSVGHAWGAGTGNGYRKCSRCRDEMKCVHPVEARVSRHCTACGTDVNA